MNLKVKNLKSGYADGFCIQDINHEFKEGVFTGIIGPNGSGKTTLLKTAAGTLTPQKGIVQLNGKNIGSYSSKERGKFISFLSSEIYINFPFTVSEIVMMGRNPYKKRFDFNHTKDRIKANEAMKKTGTFKYRDKKITELSSGEFKRVMVARTICQDTAVNIFDEPAAHLDINYVKTIFKILKRLKEKNKTVIAVMHDLNLASVYCDELLLLKDGKIFKKGKVNDVIRDEIISELYGHRIEIDRLRGQRFVLPRYDK